MLKEKDLLIYNCIENERIRQEENIELIASENYVSKDVLEAVGSILTNKYAEGYPSRRYYGGCVNVDDVENIAIERINIELLEIFKYKNINIISEYFDLFLVIFPFIEKSKKNQNIKKILDKWKAQEYN